MAVEAAGRPAALKVRKILSLLILLVLLVLLIQLFFRFFILPRTAISRILLESTLNLSDADLLALGGITGTENYISLDTEEISKQFESSPL
ncbi:MAG: hypothetical protein PQJ58_01345, partial [Spirochaetales bacterium]|nr:hypothetical protein [Spirochaetales bacterium]